MKKIIFAKRALYTLSVLVISSCSYEFPEPDPNTLPTAGTADFTKIVSVGNSLTSGFMNGALYTDGQNNSFVSIIAHQALSVGGGEFNQPDINAVNGCFNTAACGAAGRLYLKGLASPTPTPKTPGDAITAYTGDKAALNNFGVPGATLASALAPGLSQNPYYNRFASNPGTSTLIGDAAAALADGGTFFTFWLGNNDVLGYATAGASPAATLTSNGDFTTYLNLGLNAMLDANEDAKGIVANIPDVTSIPFFTTVPYRTIPLDANTAAYLQANLANNYNAFLDGMVGAHIIEQPEADLRYLSYIETTSASTNNAILINDETLTDLSPYMAGPYAGLLKYARARQTKSTDLVCLTAGSYIGKYIDKDPTPAPDSVLGVTYPLINSSSDQAKALKGDDLILIPSEITVIQTAVTDFNAIIAAAVDANSSRLALMDAYTELKKVRDADKISQSLAINGIAINASITPPYGIFSLDGVHPNARGYAYIANLFITAINTKFSARIPLCNPNDYAGNDLPVP